MLGKRQRKEMQGSDVGTNTDDRPVLMTLLLGQFALCNWGLSLHGSKMATVVAAGGRYSVAQRCCIPGCNTVDQRFESSKQTPA